MPRRRPTAALAAACCVAATATLPCKADDAGADESTAMPASLAARGAATLAAAASIAPRWQPEVTTTREALTGSTYVLGTASADNQGRPYSQLAGVDMRWWIGDGRTGFGFGAGAVGLVAPSGAGPMTLANATPTMSIAWRLRLAEGTTLFADASRASQLWNDNASDAVRTRLGMEFKGAHSAQLAALRQGVLSMQLDSGYKLSVRPRGGGLTLQLRGQF